MLPGFLWMISANAGVTTAAWVLVRRWSTGDRLTDLALLLLFRLALVSLLVLTAGATGLLTATAAGAMGSLMFGALFVRGKGAMLSGIGLRALCSPVAVASLLVTLKLALQVWLFVPHTADVLAYHLPKIAEWVRAGRFTEELGAHTHVTFPAGFELLETWWVVFLHHDALIEAAGVECLALGAAAACALARALGLTETASAVAGLLYAVTPGLQLQAVSCMNDIAVAGLLVAAAALILRRAHPGPILLAAGMGIGVKPTFAYALPGLLLLAWLIRRENAPRAPHAAAPWAAGVVGLFLGVIWYWRNAARFGNPIHPVGTGGLVDAQGGTWIQFGPSLHSLLKNASALVTDRLWDPWPTSAMLADSSGWGLTAVIVGIPAVVLLLRSEAGFRRTSAAFLLSLASILAMVLPDRWSLRFVLFFPALPAVAAARLALQNRLVLAMMALGMTAQVAATVVPAELPGPAISALARQPWQRRTAADLFGVRADGAGVGYYGGNAGCPYLLYGPDFGRRVVYLRCDGADALVDALHREQLTLLYAIPASGDQQRTLDECLRRGSLRLVREGFYSTLLF